VNNACPILPYYEWFRGDVIAAVPVDAKTVLSVGCAAGLTEAELVKRGIKVVGVEINHDAARIARERGLTVLEGDALKIDVNIGYEPYDCIIYADILEHLPDPVSVLQRHIKSLRDSGTVYVSVPNFRNYSVFWELFVKGHVIYRDNGILDRTHLRITTLRTVLDWFDKAGLVLTNYHYSIMGRRNRLISMCLLGLAREFLANQIGLVAKKPYRTQQFLDKRCKH
jgi:2-polyprenyl-3-methyl-5-hydroxy-6-metoxy-1,4-benzoquinol methylase